MAREEVQTRCAKQSLAKRITLATKLFLIYRSGRIRGQRTAIHGTLLSKGKTEELQELERKKRNVQQQGTPREARKNVHINSEDGYEKTICLANSRTNHASNSRFDRRIDLVVERVRESENFSRRVINDENQTSCTRSMPIQRQNR